MDSDVWEKFIEIGKTVLFIALAIAAMIGLSIGLAIAN